MFGSGLHWFEQVCALPHTHIPIERWGHFGARYRFLVFLQVGCYQRVSPGSAGWIILETHGVLSSVRSVSPPGGYNGNVLQQWWILLKIRCYLGGTRRCQKAGRWYPLVQGATIDTLVLRIRALLDKCEEAKFVLSLKKFEIGTSVTFAGFEVVQEGVFPHRDKAQGIRDFATPTNMTELRSFLGMVNQMNAFSPYMSRHVNLLQALLKNDVAFAWLPEHREAFKEIRRELAKGLALCHFDSALNTSLVTDALRMGSGSHSSSSPQEGLRTYNAAQGSWHPRRRTTPSSSWRHWW